MTNQSPEIQLATLRQELKAHIEVDELVQTYIKNDIKEIKEVQKSIQTDLLDIKLIIQKNGNGHSKAIVAGTGWGAAIVAGLVAAAKVLGYL